MYNSSVCCCVMILLYNCCCELWEAVCCRVNLSLHWATQATATCHCSLTEKLKHAVAVKCRKGWSDIKWHSIMYTNPQCQWNSQATMFFGNQRYTCTHTKTTYDVFAHSSLLTSAILALGLLKKNEEEQLEEKDKQFCVGGNNTF